MTAEEFIDQQEYDGVEPSGYFHGDAWDFFKTQMIKFAKYHVQEALKEACLKSRIIDDPDSYLGNTGSEYPADQIIDRESILNSYPLTNIK